MMKASAIIACVSVANFDLVNAQTTDDGAKPAKKDCLLIGGQPPIKTSPSLSFCFRNNVSGACCLTGHDQLIRDQYAAILPEMCLDMFPEFEQLMCVGCHFMQPTVMTTTDEVKEIRLCRAFAKKIYGAETNEDLDKPTERFDTCGLYVPGAEADRKILSFDDGDGNVVVIPSKYPPLQTADQFFEMFKPTFFKDYTIRIVDDGDDCFN